MSKAKELGLILTDFINLYNHFEKPPSIEAAIDEMNGGWCGVVASVCAYIFKTKYGEDVSICNNSLHIYISYKGKGYDTLYPGGYPKDVGKQWLLIEVGEDGQSTCEPAGQEVNKGYWDWGFVYIFKTLCERWDVPLPSYFGSYEQGAERMTTNNDVRSRRKRIEARYEGAKKIPMPTSVMPNKVLPYTHYELGENEPTNSKRVLVERKFKRLSDFE